MEACQNARASEVRRQFVIRLLAQSEIWSGAYALTLAKAHVIRSGCCVDFHIRLLGVVLRP
jgi:hypothetical protein